MKKGKDRVTLVIKVIVVYDSKYGNTKVVAETIVEGMREVSGTEIVLRELKEVDQSRIAEYDAILVGSPNHIGNASRVVRKFIDELGKLNLEGKQVAVFDTYMGKDFEKAVKKMEKQIGDKASALKLMAHGLSIEVKGMKGPIAAGELNKCKEFGVKIATRLKSQA